MEVLLILLFIISFSLNNEMTSNSCTICYLNVLLLHAPSQQEEKSFEDNLFQIFLFCQSTIAIIPLMTMVTYYPNLPRQQHPL